MAEPQLQPDELDRIEDALEDLELADSVDDPSPLVRARLADYRALLIASREALPMVDVPPGVLAGVLAEARRLEEDDLVELSAADDVAPQPESWWSRVRKSFLIPTLAVVGTAALILIVVTPTYEASNEEGGEVMARVETPAQAERAAASPPPAAAPAVNAEDAEPDPAAVAEEAEEAPLVEIATARRVGADESTAGAELKNEGAVGAKTTEADRSHWEYIERGDKARVGGDCFGANNEYQRALDDGDDSVRARALVGLGLCAAEQGNSARAESLFEEARALDPEVASYIGTQRRDEKPKAPKAMPRKKQNSRHKAAMPAEAYQSDSLPGDAVNQNPFKD